jgi:hypothetical protein
MRRRITLLAAVVVLGACSQEDQTLPFESEPGKPVTSTMGSGSTTISTPDGISLTMPAGALPAGTEITVAKLDRTAGESIPGAVGDVYLIGFDGVPTSDPSISFSSTLGEEATAGQLVGMVPVVLRVAAPGTTPAGNLTASRFVSHMGVQADAAETSAQAKFDALMQAGIFDGFNGSATIQDGMNRQQFASVISNILALDLESPTPPLFTDLGGDDWASSYISAATGAGFVSGLNSGTFEPFFAGMSAILDVLGSNSGAFSAAYLQPFREYASGGGSVFLITTFGPSIIPAYPIVALPAHDSASNRIIPGSSTSATFTLVCTGIQWPSAEDVPTCSENTIDVRVGSELLSRFPASVIVPNYLLAEMTLDADGSATGNVEYETFLRSALSSGITGVGRKGSLDLDGSWSVNGDTITIGGHDFLYTVPDSESLILSVSDSIKLENNDGTDSWQPVKVNVKLARQ